MSTLAFLMSNAKNLFGEIPEPNTFIPIFMLLLFIISATVTGSLVLGKPILLYLDGSKKDALVLLFSTLIWLVVFLCAVAVALVL